MIDKQNAQEPRRDDASPDPAGSPDRRRAQRSGRERGLRVFIPAAVLEAAGVELDAMLPAPLYELQAVKESDRRSRRSVIVRLFPAD